ncbi:PRC-barrel domain-containing protein [Candidatus Woesearchaeota archaeon]|nr:PRC-barrel domain-containing protein [Candidatus Woesearchaeota archaeon]
MPAETEEKKYARQIVGKTVVSKTGKKFGEVQDVIFDVKTGELLQVILKNPTGYAEGLELERSKAGDFLIPYSSVIAYGDFVVVAEEDIL